MTKQAKNWIVVFSYIGFIYLTLGYVRAPLNFLRAQGWLVLSLNFVFVFLFLSLFWKFLQIKPVSAPRVFFFLSIFVVYFFLSKIMSSPEEQIHFIEYGLVGVLFLRALASHWGYKMKSFWLALVLGSGAGWLDEIIQGVLPNRHYDPKDIIWNVISVFLGLLIFGLFKPPTQAKIETSKT